MSTTDVRPVYTTIATGHGSVSIISIELKIKHIFLALCFIFSSMIITHLVYLLRCDWSIPCHVVQFILMLLHATWCSRASFLELLPLARPGNSSRNDARQNVYNVFLQFATGILVIKTAEKHVILKHIFKKHVLNVLHVLTEMVMVCYKTDVDWPYSGNSIRLHPPRACWSPQNQSISRGRCPREIDWFWGDQRALGGNRRMLLPE